LRGVTQLRRIRLNNSLICLRRVNWSRTVCGHLSLICLRRVTCLSCIRRLRLSGVGLASRIGWLGAIRLCLGSISLPCSVF
jgi:hypothetical protein